ncbi:M23 family metallopeptidase [Bacillus sp. FJAT-47783]|uniref:M23 family metallopeptidase n=1 Tax=Bacillus sp. FJAT-47783 TaxID=2922712 RepID=UPI001FABBA4D|nr:M23 family metallopeptidase [Bacillus sp. FJAT-47783]
MREEEKKRTSQGAKFQQFFRKKWFFPAVYLLSAAVILTAVLWYQAVRDDIMDENTEDTQDLSYRDDSAIEVNRSVENFKMPAIDPDAVKVVTNFYDFNASSEEQEEALVLYDHTYHQNQGIDLAREDGKEFEVVASLSGTVTKAQKDPLLGYVVEVEHDDNLVTVYQSLANVDIKEGDQVEQGEVIGKAGKNQFNQEAGVHAHFEIRKDGKAYNPLNYMEKPMTSIADETETKEAAEEGTQTEEEENETPSEDEKEDENSSTKPNEPEASLDTMTS